MPRPEIAFSFVSQAQQRKAAAATFPLWTNTPWLADGATPQAVVQSRFGSAVGRARQKGAGRWGKPSRDGKVARCRILCSVRPHLRGTGTRSTRRAAVGVSDPS